jgi:capsular exopolysaccharide synthesis family protein
MPRLQSEANSIILLSDPGSPVSEAYRTLRINVDFAAVGREMKTIAITSTNREEGKSTTALNLAVANAQVGRNVLLVDADLRKPSIHHVLGMTNSIGLTTLLGELGDGREAIRETYIDNLSVMTSGPIPFNPSELLASTRFDSLLEEWKQAYDLIIIDTPPALSLLDAKIVATKSDGVLLVVQQRKVKRDEASRLMKDLAVVHSKLLGVVINKINNKDAEVYPYP